MKRRERTRHLTELGGFVVKAGIVELAGDDRAVILAFISKGGQLFAAAPLQ
ncbi:conjugal transfer protein TraD [Sphingobium sp. AN641]|uniref:conjugal transfer protein TraD n=1 Tax=Sphingobium sp. AN641 TaxID=3133443 RepID=UPI0030C00167